MTARTYPEVRFVTVAIPLRAQVALTTGIDLDQRAVYAAWVVLGMGLDPAKAKVDLNAMTVKYTL